MTSVKCAVCGYSFTAQAHSPFYIRRGSHEFVTPAPLPAEGPEVELEGS